LAQVFGDGDPKKLQPLSVPKIIEQLERALMDIKYSQSEKNDDSVFGQTENVPMKSLEHLPRQFIGKELMLFEMVGILNGKITELEQKISKMQKNETVNTETIQKISEAEYDQSKSLVGVELKQREVNVNEMISDVVESSKIESKLPILLGLDHDVVILADKISMTKVIQTILTNSIKATKNGHIKVESFVAYDQNVFILRIYDTGCGIPKEVLPNIFEKTHIDKNSNEGNTLSWCKKIIKLHDGKISAKNNDKGGATFTITLPIKKD
jgi:signal transduction histidine kinase